MASKKWQEENADKMREYRREWYRKNREQEIQKTVKRKAERRAEISDWLEEIKSTLKCSRCGEDHPACLDFHHLEPDEKEIGIANAISQGWSKDRIQKEMDKCILLCANCHRKLHYEERNMRV